MESVRICCDCGEKYEIRFDPDKHKYYLDGRQLHGGSSMAELVANPGWRIPWACKMAAVEAEQASLDHGLDELAAKSISDRVRVATKKRSQDAINFGNTVHGFLEKWVKYRITQKHKPTRPKSDAVWNAVLPFLKWEKKENPMFTHSEQVVYCPPSSEGSLDDYAGTLDLRFNLNEKKCLGDFKSSKVLSREYIFQLALYGNAVEKTESVMLDDLYLFRLPKIEGDTIQIVVFPFTDKLRRAAESISFLKHLAVDVEKWLRKQ